MKWDECFPEICHSLYRIKVTSSSGTRKGTGFVFANYTTKNKIDFVLATARHVVENLPEWETICWELEKFDWRGISQNKIVFKTNVDATGKNAVRSNKDYDIGAVFVPLLTGNGLNKHVRLIDPRCAIIPGARVGWAGFPEFVNEKTLNTHPCYFEGVISTVVDRDNRLFYLVDGHGGKGVSGGPLWCWNDEKENYDIIGICSQYVFPKEEKEKHLPGIVAFESINPLVAYLKTSTEIEMNIIINEI